jgi:transcriptional regulator with XRE-family HTH domain
MNTNSIDFQFLEEYNLPAMTENPPKETKQLIKEAKAWAKRRRGGATEIARELGVERQTVTNWLAGRRTPMLKHWFALEKFLAGRKESPE